MTALPDLVPHIRFLFVRLVVCYRLPSSIRCLLDSAELLVLPATGRTVDFHHTITRALPGAQNNDDSRRCRRQSAGCRHSPSGKSNSMPLHSPAIPKPICRRYNRLNLKLLPQYKPCASRRSLPSKNQLRRKASSKTDNDTSLQLGRYSAGNLVKPRYNDRKIDAYPP